MRSFHENIKYLSNFAPVIQRAMEKRYQTAKYSIEFPPLQRVVGALLQSIILLFCTVFPISAFSQKQVHLQEIESRKPVGYANIYIGDAVFYTDKEGNIEIADTVSTIKVSHICYADTLVSLPESKEVTILMMPKQYDLPEITVRKGTRGKQEQIGPIQKKESLFFGGRNGMCIGVYLPYQEHYENKFIYSIVAYLYESKALDYDRAENAVLRFDLRQPDAQTGAPSSLSLIEGGVLYEGKANGRKTINIECPIRFPHSGVYVVLEWIVKGECQDNVIYNPHIRMSKSDHRSVTWLKREYKKEEWVSWNNDIGMQQLQAVSHGKPLNANIGVVIAE